MVRIHHGSPLSLAYSLVRPHRLVVRTPPSQGGNGGSSPPGVAISKLYFLFDEFLHFHKYQSLAYILDLLF